VKNTAEANKIIIFIVGKGCKGLRALMRQMIKPWRRNIIKLLCPILVR
jgi:hypothetical protein